MFALESARNRAVLVAPYFPANPEHSRIEERRLRRLYFSTPADGDASERQEN